MNTSQKRRRRDADIQSAAAAAAHSSGRHYQSALNDELVNTTSVLLELLFSRDGAYSFDFDTDEVNVFISCISRQ